MGSTVDRECAKMVALSNFMDKNPQHTTHKEVVADINCPGYKDASAKLFTACIELKSYIAKYDEVLLLSSPITTTAASSSGQTPERERDNGKLGRGEMKEAKIAAQPGNQLAKSMQGMGKALSTAFADCTNKTNISREKTASIAEKTQAGINYQKELLRHEEKVRRQVKEWRASQQLLISNLMSLLDKMPLLYEDPVERKSELAKSVAEMKSIQSQVCPPEVLDVTPADKALLASFKATFEFVPLIPIVIAPIVEEQEVFDVEE